MRNKFKNFHFSEAYEIVFRLQCEVKSGTILVARKRKKKEKNDEPGVKCSILPLKTNQSRYKPLQTLQTVISVVLIVLVDHIELR